MEISTSTEILKEEVIDLHFPSDDVISSASGKKDRMAKLLLATRLGNLEKGKIRIYFSDMDGAKMVETTIWATSDKNIVIKKGMTIPIHRVSDIKFY